jgi:MFS family permease
VTERTARLRHDLGFRRFWTASTVSAFGSYISDLAVAAIIVQVLHGTVADVGFVKAAGMAPYVAVGLFAGVLADRMRRKPVLVSTDFGRAVVLAAIPLLAVTGTLTVAVLAALMVVFGVLSVLNVAANQSFLPRLVPRELLPRANARLQQSDAAAQTAGPLLGGGVIAAVGAPLAVLVDAVSFALSGLLVAATPAMERPARPATRSVLAELREGVRWVFWHPTLRPLALSTHGWRPPRLRRADRQRPRRPPRHGSHRHAGPRGRRGSCSARCGPGRRSGPPAPDRQRRSGVPTAAPSRAVRRGPG